jgi:hypothetical protein
VLEIDDPYWGTYHWQYACASPRVPIFKTANIPYSDALRRAPFVHQKPSGLRPHSASPVASPSTLRSPNPPQRDCIRALLESESSHIFGSVSVSTTIPLSDLVLSLLYGYRRARLSLCRISPSSPRLSPACHTFRCLCPLRLPMWCTYDYFSIRCSRPLIITKHSHVCKPNPLDLGQWRWREYRSVLENSPHGNPFIVIVFRKCRSRTISRRAWRRCDSA